MEELGRVYNKIFDLEFLIKYGYYDIDVKHIVENSGDSEKNLQKIEKDNDIFEEEVVYTSTDQFYPKYFNMEDVVIFLRDKNIVATIDENFNINYDNNNVLGNNNKWTDPIIFTIPKKNEISIRRTYKMPNIFSYIRLAHYISLNKNYFIELFSNNKQSTSKYFNQLVFSSFGITDKIQTRALSYGTKVLNLDLSNFYPSLYTHSLAWVDLGKQVAKNDHTNGIGNNLDKLIQAEQYGETHGVPTGNFLTRIVTEYFLCRIDNELESEGYHYVRYVDDLRYAYNKEDNKEEFLSIVHDKSNEYNITLNENKTKIEKYPFENKLNKERIFTFFDNFSSNDATKWIDKIYNYINLCIDEESNGNKGSIKTMFKGSLYPLINNDLINDVFTYTDTLSQYNLFKHFLDISLKDSKLTNHFLEFTEKLEEYGVNRELLNELAKEYFEENSKKIQEKIENCIENKYNQEVYQLLLYSLVFSLHRNTSQSNVLNLVGEEVENGLDSLLLSLIHVENDDFSITLAVTIYLEIIIDNYFLNREFNRYQLYMNNLFKKIEKLFFDSFISYINIDDRTPELINDHESSRMAEKFWFVRYFIYGLANKYTSFDRAQRTYLNNLGTPSDRRGYNSHLNWNFVKTNTTIDLFYDSMLSENVELFHYEFEHYS